MAVTSTLSDLWISNTKSHKMSNLTPSCSLINSFLFMCTLTVRLFAFWCCLFTKYNGGLWIQIWLFLFLMVSFFLFCCFLFFLSLSHIHGAKWALKTSKCFSHCLVLQAVDTKELLVFQSRVETRNAFHSEKE